MDQIKLRSPEPARSYFASGYWQKRMTDAIRDYPMNAQVLLRLHARQFKSFYRSLGYLISFYEVLRKKKSKTFVPASSWPCRCFSTFNAHKHT